MADQKLILSLTSYPARIQFVPSVLESLLSQSRPADLIVLYLSADQFPQRDGDLPDALLQAKANQQLEIRWVNGDLKPHKKYFYAFREYPDDIIVTVDDDVFYEPVLLERLWETHLQFPDAVVAGQTHLITLDRSGQPNPYKYWLRRTFGFENGPSMQLFAVGIGGVLYHPRWFPEELYNEEVIRKTCLTADDLWLKTMELAAGIPVVFSPASTFLRIVPGSQKTSLYQYNLDQDRNDESLAAIRDWADSFYGKDFFSSRLAGGQWPAVRDESSLYTYLNDERKRILDASHATSMKLRIAEKDKARQLGEISDLRREIDRLHQELDTIRNSSSFKLGSTLSKPLNKLRGKP